MHGHPLLASLLSQLQALERSARELRAPLIAGQTEAARQTLLAAIAERASCEEARAIADLRARRLERAIEENRRRYEGSLRAFERFRQGFKLLESLRDLHELPKLLEKLAGLLKVECVHLVLDACEFAEFVPLGFPVCDQATLADVAGRIRSAGTRCYVGPARNAPGEIFHGLERDRFGSCFAYPLADRFHEGLWTGLLLVADANAKRYSPDMATDYMEHFCDAVKSTVAGIRDRNKAERLRDDVERMTRHDLRSPLTAILSLPQFLLEDSNLTERQRQMAGLIMAAGRRMQNMITLSLSLYRMEQGVYELVPGSVDLRALVETVWQEIGGPYRAVGMSLKMTCGEERFACQGEELLCYTMLANLLNNALEASAPGEAISVHLHRQEGRGVVEIGNSRDVPAEVRERFFEKYATAGKPGGTGLGTYTARLIASVHGGNISMRTGLGQGTVVRVELPGADASDQRPPVTTA